MLTGRYLTERIVETIGAAKLCREPFRWRVPVVMKQVCDTSGDAVVLKERVIGQVLDGLHAQRVGNAALVNLTFRHPDAELAAEVVNTLGSLYLDRHLGVLRNPRSEAFLQEQSTVLKQRLAEAENELEAFKVSNAITSSIKDERELIGRQLIPLQTVRTELTMREAEVNSRIAKRADARAFPLEPQNQNPTPARARLFDLEKREAEMAVRLGDNNPDLISMREEVRKARKLALEEDALQNRVELSGLRARQATQDPKLAQLANRLQALDRLEPDFDRLQQKLQLAQQNYRLYVAKTEEFRLSTAMDAQRIASVRVIEAARAPMSPLNSKLSMQILIAAIFGLLGGLVIGFVLELFGDRLETPERVESVLDLPVLGSIPAFPK